MKFKKLLQTVLIFTCLASFTKMNAQVYSKTPLNVVQGPQQRTCGTEIPSDEWEQELQKRIAEFISVNNITAKVGPNSNQAVYTIPVIIHVIHGGQAVGTWPNLAQGQLNSQVQVLNNDFAGVGQNVGNYPATAFTAWATNTIVSAASKDGSGRIKIANTGVTFCYALTDTLGNTLAEPGIHRVNYNTLPALTGTFTSKNPADAAYNNSTKLQAFINGYIKPNTIWNVRKYMNIWVSDQNSSVGLLGYATFPPLSGLTGIPGATGTSTTDGFWSYGGAFGSSTIFPGGFYSPPYDKGRTCTHEIGHWVGLRHIWGDGTCLTDYCNDTPPAAGPNFGAPAYPVTPGSCAGPPSNSPNGEMAMNFMDYTDDLAMYMFTEDQRTRLQTAMANSPYRNQLGTHGLCSVPPPVANFTISPNPICAGQTATLTDLSTGSPGAWSYTMTGGTPSTSTLQIATVTYTAAGVYSITLIASNGGGSSAPVVRTITVNAIPSLTVTSTPTAICGGGSATITSTGATTYTLNTGATGSNIVVTPTVTTNYTVTGANGSCTSTRTIQISVGTTPTINITPASPTVCTGSPVILTGSGATTYTWNTGATTSTLLISPTVTTTYTLSGRNGGLCTGTRTVSVFVNPLPTVTITANPTSICAGSTSTLSATATGPGPWTYTWSTGANTSTITRSVTGVYTATVQNANGCRGIGSFTLNSAPAPTVTAVASPTSICAGSSATLTAGGASAYSWNTGATTTVIVVNPTVSTTYTVTGFNGGCSGTRTVAVVVNPTPTVTAMANPSIMCSGGSSTITASGAATYSWSTGSTSTSITVSPTLTTTYSVTGTNSFGCSSTRTVSVFIGTPPNITVTATPSVICSGQSSTLAIAGATSYTWSTGSTSSGIVVSPTITTTYSVIATNGGGCPATRSITVSVGTLPTINAIASPSIMCPGSTSTITASGATSYTWNTGATSAAIAVTPTATTNYTVTGSNGGCIGTRTVSVFIMSSPTINIVASPTAICNGQTSTLTASGASSYTWTGGPTGATYVVTPTTTTTYTVTGSNGTCSSTRTISLLVNSNPFVAAAASPTSICAGGSSTLFVTGALTYTWSTGGSGTAIVVSPTTTTTYTVTGFSSAGCSTSTTVPVAVISSPIINAVANPSIICSGSSSTLTASGASSYTWNPGGTGTSIVVTPTANTTYTVTGGSGSCISTRTVSVFVTSSPTISATTNPTIICIGQSATVTANGATTYSWNTGATGSVIAVSPTVTTTYTITGTSGGCSSTRTVNVNVSPNPLVLAASSPSAICAGASSTLYVTGTLTYTWSTGGTGSAQVVTPGVSTTYTVTGFNSAGCSSTTTVSVLVNSSPTVNVIPNPGTICQGQTSVLNASGASSYTWNTGATSSSIAVTPTSTTVYTVTGSNGGCNTVRTVTVNVMNNPSISAIANPTSICAGGSSTLMVAGGASSYSWSTGSTVTTILVTPTVSTNYTVTGFLGACSSSMVVGVAVNNNPSVAAASSHSMLCIGQTATLAATGASSYSWSTGSSGPVIAVSPTTTTTYTVIGTTGGCSTTTVITQNVSTCIGVIEMSAQTPAFAVYPNPTPGEFFVILDKFTENTYVEIFNSLGQLISRSQVKEQNTRIDLSKEANGVYHLRVLQDNKQIQGTKVLKD